MSKYHFDFSYGDLLMPVESRPDYKYIWFYWRPSHDEIITQAAAILEIILAYLYFKYYKLNFSNLKSNPMWIIMYDFAYVNFKVAYLSSSPSLLV